MKNIIKRTKLLLCACGFVFFLFPAMIPGSALASEPFIGQITMFAGTFAPRGWAFCDGQLLPISGNEALFSILGTTYGGDGRTTFALPDLRGRLPMGARSGPGLTPRDLGDKEGVETVTLTTSQMPSHNHSATALADPVEGDSEDPTEKAWAKTGSGELDYGNYSPEDAENMAADAMAVGNTGGTQSHNNLPPYTGIHYIIALIGIWPS